MDITAIPPTTPPAIAPEFELWSTVVEDVLEVVEESGAEDVATVTLERQRRPTGRESRQERAQDCLLREMRSEPVVTREGKTRERELTTDGIRFVGVPKVLILKCAVNKAYRKKTGQRTVTSRSAH
jgi:hypothetical protein